MYMSRSTWACELKCMPIWANWASVKVTLHVSVWVEIATRTLSLLAFSVTLHVSVWVEIARRLPVVEEQIKSRSTWACELKYLQNMRTFQPMWSHAPRERVSWNTHFTALPLYCTSHAPRERVSWNEQYCHSPSFLRSHAPRERVSWNRFIFPKQ